MYSAHAAPNGNMILFTRLNRIEVNFVTCRIAIPHSFGTHGTVPPGPQRATHLYEPASAILEVVISWPLGESWLIPQGE